MQKTPELARLLEGRGNLYRFLSRFYLWKLTKPSGRRFAA